MNYNLVVDPNDSLYKNPIPNSHVESVLSNHYKLQYQNQQQKSSQNQSHELQVPLFGDSKNLQVFSFVLDKSPYAQQPLRNQQSSAQKYYNDNITPSKTPTSYRCNQQSSVKKDTTNQQYSQSPFRQSRANYNQQTQLSASKSVYNQSAQKSYMQNFEQNLQESQPVKYSPAQSHSSGSRMYNQYYIYQQKLQQKRQERDNHIESQMREKPQICKKSQDIVDNGPSIASYGMEEQLKRHQNCYYKHNHEPIQVHLIEQQSQRKCGSQSARVHNENKITLDDQQKQDKIFSRLKDWDNNQKQNPQRASTPCYKSKGIQNKQGQLSMKENRKICASEKKTQKESVQNYQSFGPTIEQFNKQHPQFNQPHIHNQSMSQQNNMNKNLQNQETQGETMLKKLCQQYNLKFDSISQRDQQIIGNIIDKQLNIQEIQKVPLTDRQHKNNQPHVKLNVQQKTLPLQNYQKPQKKQPSIISKIRKFRESTDKTPYFNVGIHHGRPSQKNSIDLQDKQGDKYFKENLRKTPQKEQHSNSKYHQIRKSRTNSLSNQKSQRSSRKANISGFIEQQSPMTYERQLIWKQNIDNQIRVQQNEKEIEETKDCVFKPQISKLEENHQYHQNLRISKGSESYRQIYNQNGSQSPLMSQRQSINQSYKQLSAKKCSLIKLQQQKYPQIQQLRVSSIGKQSDHCSSPHCNNQMKQRIQANNQSNIKMHDISSDNINRQNVPLKFQIQKIKVKEPSDSQIQSVVQQYLHKKEELKKPRFILKKNLNQSIVQTNHQPSQQFSNLNNLNSNLNILESNQIKQNIKLNEEADGQYGIIQNTQSTDQLEFTLRNLSLQSLQSQALQNIAKLNRQI
eukprot:403375282